MAKRARLPRHLRREAVAADGAHPVRAGPLHDERPGANLLANGAPRGLRLAGEDRLVEPQIGGREQLPVGRDLIARLEQRDILDEDVLDGHRPHAPVAPDPRVRGDEQREPIQGALGADLLGDADGGVGDDHAEEQRVAPVAERERQHPEAGEDRVEDGQHVGPHDARVRTAGALRLRASADPQPTGRLVVAQPALHDSAVSRSASGNDQHRTVPIAHHAGRDAS